MLMLNSPKLIWIGSLLLLFTVVLGVCFSRLASFSPKPVIEGEIYRSKQPEGLDLERATAQFGLKTVVNLRGRYSDEGCRDLGLDCRGFDFYSTDWPAQSETRSLVNYLFDAPRPVLIHCLAGADRSGWAAALVLALAGEPLEEALGELHWIHGHFCSPEDCYLHRFFAQYDSWLREAERPHDADAFRYWVEQAYTPGPYNAEITLLSAPQASIFPAGARIDYRVEVLNASPETWHMSDEPGQGIRLGARVIGPFDVSPEQPVELFRFQTGPPRDLARAGMAAGEMRPGHVRGFEIGFLVPEAPGRYYLQLDMVNERVHWFSDLGGPGLVIEIEVTDG
jgi:hypothetical protein